MHENKQVPYQHQSSPSSKFPGDYSRNFVPDQQCFPGASPRDKSTGDGKREERETIILLDIEQENLRDKEKILRRGTANALQFAEIIFTPHHREVVMQRQNRYLYELAYY